MDRSGSVTSRRTRTAIAIALLVSAALSGQPSPAAATTGGLSFGAVSWSVDTVAGTTTFSVEVVVNGAKVAGTPCVSFCILDVYGAKEADGAMVDVEFVATSGQLRPQSGSFTLVLTGTLPRASDATHLELVLYDFTAWSTGFRPISELVGVVVPDVTDDLFPSLEPFLDGLSWVRVGDTVELAEDMDVVAELAATVCAAAEEALARPGGSKGKRLGTIDEETSALAALCVLVSEVAGTSVPDAVDEVASRTLPPRGRPGGSDDVPGEANGLDGEPGGDNDG